MKILIVGAGVGGLGLAGLLRQRGIESRLIERASDVDHAGYMIALYPMGNRVLHGLGLFEKFREKSAAFRYYEICNGQSEVLHRFDLGAVEESFGMTGQLLRKDLLEILRSAAPDVPLKTLTTPRSIEDRGDKVHVVFSDGSEEEFDGVVGADGIHSATRKAVAEFQPNEETGWGLWIWWGPFDQHPRDTIREFWGHNRLVGIYPTPTLTCRIAAAPKSLIHPEIIAGEGQRVRRNFEDLRGEAAGIMETFPDNTRELFYWNLADRKTSRWMKGRIALLGDSACAFLPTAGLGASMALESAAVLADELSRTDATHLPRALEHYEKRRKHRVEAAQREARHLAAWMTTSSNAMAWTRDQFIKAASVDSLVHSIARSMDEPV